MGAALSSMRLARGFDMVRPLSLAPLRAIMPPLIFLPLSTDRLAIHITSSSRMPSCGARLLTRAPASEMLSVESELRMGWYASYIFPRFLDWALGNAECGKLRRQALASAQGCVIEIGFGTGLNLAHYPEQVAHLTVIDQARMLPERVAQRVALARMPVEQMQLDASGRLPFDDHSFDAAVSTWTLCSIAHLGAALQEIRRVLKPEGQFIFLEHGRSDDPQVARRQDLFNPLQKFITSGCQINRPINRSIEDAGLKLTKLERFLLPHAPRLAGEMYCGTASPNKI